MALNEMDALIVKNLSHLNLASQRVAQSIEPSVFKVIVESIERWRIDIGWTGEVEEDKVSFWMAPPAWSVPDEQGGDPTYLAFFRFCRENDHVGPDADQFDLVSLCGAGRERFGIRFLWDRGLGIKKQAWRKIASASPAMTQLLAAGFRYEEQQGDFFTPVTFDSVRLAEGIIENNLTSFTSPLSDALNSLPGIVSVFQLILDAAQNQNP